MMYTDIMKIILYVVLSLIGIVFFVLIVLIICPSGYRLEVDVNDSKSLVLYVKSFTGLFRGQYTIKDNKREFCWKFFGIRIKKLREKEKKKQSRAGTKGLKQNKSSGTAKMKSAVHEIMADSNRPALKIAADQILKILHEFKPENAKGKMIIGFDSPDVTAIAYSIAADITMITDVDIAVVPNMEKQVFNVDIDVEGSFMPAKLLLYIKRLLTDKKIKTIVKKVRSI